MGRKKTMEELVKFFFEVGKLKKMARKGWVINNIKNPESIAEHVFRAALMAWFLGTKKKGLNIERIIKMALIHDLCEIYAGDTTPYDSVLPRTKKQREKLMKTWPRFSDSKKKQFALSSDKKIGWIRSRIPSAESISCSIPSFCSPPVKWKPVSKGIPFL